MVLNTKIITYNFAEKYEKYEKREEIDYFKIFSRYVDSGAGAYRFFRLFKNGCKWTVIGAKKYGLNYDFIKNFSVLSKKFGFVSSALILTKAPITFRSFQKSYSSYVKIPVSMDSKGALKSQGKQITYEKIKKRDNLIKKITMLFADFSFIMQFFESLKVFSLNPKKPITEKAAIRPVKNLVVGVHSDMSKFHIANTPTM